MQHEMFMLKEMLRIVVMFKLKEMIVIKFISRLQEMFMIQFEHRHNTHKLFPSQM